MSSFSSIDDFDYGEETPRTGAVILSKDLMGNIEAVLQNKYQSKSYIYDP